MYLGSLKQPICLQNEYLAPVTWLQNPSDLGYRGQTPISALLVNPEHFYQNAENYASIARIASRPLPANALVTRCKCAGVCKVWGVQEDKGTSNILYRQSVFPERETSVSLNLEMMLSFQQVINQQALYIFFFYFEFC